jgi:hypothetical protein
MQKYLKPYRYKRKLYHFSDKVRKFEYNPELDPTRFIVDFHRLYFSDLPLVEIKNLFKQGEKDYEFAVENSVHNFPEIWKSGRTLGSLTSALVNLVKPEIVVETGVANGVSSRIITKNLLTTSTLYSFDTDPLTSESVSGCKNWRWNLVDTYRPEESLLKVVSKIGPDIDIWIHDSDHSGYWQNFEYKIAIKNLKVGGFLISDDIQDSSAWLRNFGTSGNLQFSDGHKLIGIWRKET